jgi:uncharacterized ion transporter superfamily protein YfcC
MAEQQKKRRNLVKDLSFRVAKASVKAVLVYLLYFFLAPMLAPLFEMVPGFMESIEAFIIVYIVLMILSDITSKTIFEHFFNTARALFFMGYLLLSMGDGVLSMSYESFSLTVNLTMFYAIATTLSLLGLAKTILQAINFMHERAEAAADMQL